MWLATFSNQNKRRGSSSVTSPRVLFDIQMLRKKNHSNYGIFKPFGRKRPTREKCIYKCYESKVKHPRAPSLAEWTLRIYFFTMMVIRMTPLLPPPAQKKRKWLWKWEVWQHTDLEWFSLAFYPVRTTHSTRIFLVYLLTVGRGIVFTMKKTHTQGTTKW